MLKNKSGKIVKRMTDDKLNICQEYSINPENTNKAINSLNQHNIIELANIFKIVGSPIRLAILLAIEDQELCVCEISKVIDLSVSAISHHLRILRDNRLVKDRRQGKQVFYSLKDQHVSQLLKMMAEHLDEKISTEYTTLTESITNEDTQ
ncbi:MAG: ArsR/SmtB family transcription factor [Candidatus Hodarchaeales archaeon]